MIAITGNTNPVRNVKAEIGRFVPGVYWEMPRIWKASTSPRRRFSVGAFGFWLCVWWEAGDYCGWSVPELYRPAQTLRVIQPVVAPATNCPRSIDDCGMKLPGADRLVSVEGATSAQ